MLAKSQPSGRGRINRNGDRMQLTAPDKEPGVANRDLAVIESIASDGQIASITAESNSTVPGIGISITAMPSPAITRTGLPLSGS